MKRLSRSVLYAALLAASDFAAVPRVTAPERQRVWTSTSKPRIQTTITI